MRRKVTHWSPGKETRTACGIFWPAGARPSIRFTMYAPTSVTCKRCLRKIRVERVTQTLDEAIKP